jgi:hypothetical protein
MENIFGEYGIRLCFYYKCVTLWKLSINLNINLNIVVFRRTRSLNAPSPIYQFGPCGRIVKNTTMVM